ncbi:dihydropteroate synthase [Sedimentitalea todarodis]|uniref:Dihydropteroate synthase n=1 Tax=Sedimentitalea todarodis TaxID=1631240 RepID=A0ABU3VFC7_9RHOB|nr:dihydropteroate synthase [Sedimentitalea todarodis]MDU9004882.1 dihydropteroate synthase [Sedimentitalea todarodis]
MSPAVRPLVQHGATRPKGALPLAGSESLWFTHAEILDRTAPPRLVPASELPADLLENLTAPRKDLMGLDMSVPQLMGILNVTPDSFSDGGVHFDPGTARNAALSMIRAGATIIDIGGESTRPGADTIDCEVETIRTAPVIAALRQETDLPISIDTRKSTVARAALDAGASLVNDVAGFTYDPDLAPLCAAAGVPVCIMHALGDPATMQQNPHYDDVVLDVFAYLQTRVASLSAIGIPRDRMVIDPGIGFGKTEAHNLALLRNLSLFHGLGCPILLGVSRKRFIGTIGQAPDPATRAPGSIAVGLAALAQGVQILRVHDVDDTAQALRLWAAAR